MREGNIFSLFTGEDPIQLRGDTPVRSVPPPRQDRMEYPPPLPPPLRETEQRSEYLLHGRRYASWVHAGGLSCFYFISFFTTSICLSIILRLKSCSFALWYTKGNEQKAIFLPRYYSLYTNISSLVRNSVDGLVRYLAQHLNKLRQLSFG